MIITIQPVTIGKVTTDKAILNASFGDSTVSISLYPVIEVNGTWTKLDTDVIPLIGLTGQVDIDALFSSVESAIQVLTNERGI